MVSFSALRKYLFGFAFLAPAFAATANWSLPGDAIQNQGDFGSCTWNYSSRVVSCDSSVNLDQAGILTVSESFTLRFQQNQSLPEGIIINPSSNFNLTIEAPSGLNLNSGSTPTSIRANISVSNSSFNLDTNTEVEGNITASNVNLKSGSTVRGSIDATGSVEVNGRVEGNVFSNGSVTVNSNGFAQSVNARGSVSNNGVVRDYINAPTITNHGTVGVTCNENNNEGPCSGFAGINEVCEQVWPREATESFSTQAPFPTPSNPQFTTLPPSGNTLAPADYVVGGDLVLNQGGNQATISYSTSGTTTRIFIDGNLQLGADSAPGQSPQVRMNYSGNEAGPPENLVIIINGDLIVGERVRASAYFFVNGNVDVRATGGGNNRFLVAGSLTATGTLSQNFSNNTEISYQPPPPSLDSGGFCEALSGVSGSLLVIDDFEAYDPGSAIGRSGGEGNWGGSWQGGTDSQTIIDTSASPLSYLAPNGEAIIGGNRALRLRTNNDRAAYRDLDAEYGDEVVYVSMLAQFDVDRTRQNRFAALWFGASGFTDVPNVGLKTREGNQGTGANDFFVRTTRSNDVYSKQLNRNETYFIVARFNKDNATGNYNRMQLWVNPETLTNKPEFDVETTGNSNINSFSQLGFRLTNLASNETVTVDRLAVGTSWQDVVSPAPTLRAHFPLDLCFNNAPILELINGNNGQPNQVRREPDGQVGPAARFDGENSFIDIPAQTLNGLTDFSVSAWVNPQANNSFRTILSGSNNETNTTESSSQFEIYLNPNNFLRVGFKGNYLRFGSSEPTLLGSSEPTLPNNVWSHVVVTKIANEICLYINGNLQSCNTVNSTSALRVEQAAIGAWRTAPNSHDDIFNGAIDEVKVFSMALTNTRVEQIYNRQSAGLNIDGTNREDSCKDQCFVDGFDSGLSQSWVLSSSSGSFTPTIVGAQGSVPNRLRLTEDSGNQATAVTLQRIFPAQNNRVVVEFDYYGWSSRSGTGADGVAVILSNAAVTARPGSYGGSLGYAQRNNGDPGFAGGWIGIGLDEFGNYSQDNEGRNEGPGFRRNAVAIRGSVASDYLYLEGTEAGLSPPIDLRSTSSPGPGHRYRIIVDTRGAGAFVSVERDTGSGFVALIEPFNAAGISNQGMPPEEMLLSFTGSTGGSSNFHEIGNVSVCADVWRPVGSQVERFRIRHVQNGINCLASEFEVKACADINCSTPFTEQPVTVTMNDTEGEYIGGNTFTLVNGQGSFRIQNPTPGGQSQLQVLSSSPVARPLSTDICQTLNGSPSDCIINFNPAGLVLSSSANDFTNQLNNQIAGVQFPTFLHVVDTDENLACQPRLIDETLDVEFTVSCLDPEQCAGGNEAYNVNGAALNIDNATNRYQSTRALNFNGSSLSLTNLYTDVGHISLSASMTLPRSSEAGAEGPELELSTSADFIVAPFKLVINAQDRDGESNPSSTSNGAGFVAAGENFRLTIDSFNALGNITSSFGRESQIQSIAKLDSLVYPTGGVDDAALFNFGQFEQHDLGRVRSSSARWDEAGTIRLAPDYIAEGLYDFARGVTEMHSTDVGRFFPAQIYANSLALMHSCQNNFSYMSQQDIEATFELEARSVSGRRTDNYGITSNEAYLTRIGVGADIVPRSRVMHSNFSAWQQGQLNVAMGDSNSFIGIERADTPDGPLSPSIGLIIAGRTDPIEFINSDFSSFESNATPDGVLLGDIDVRYGRLKLADIFGPENEPLPLVIQAEFWDEDRQVFVPNIDDSCTIIDVNAIRADMSLEPVGNQSTLLAGREEPGVGPAWPAVNELINFDFCIDVEPWLSWPNPNSIAECGSNSPSATATFGQFRGNDRVIYWLERGF